MSARDLSDFKYVVSSMDGLLVRQVYGFNESKDSLDFAARFIDYLWTDKSYCSYCELNDLPKLYYTHKLDLELANFLAIDEYCKEHSISADWLQYNKDDIYLQFSVYTALSKRARTSSGYFVGKDGYALGIDVDDMCLYTDYVIKVSSLVNANLGMHGAGTGLEHLRKFCKCLTGLPIMAEAGYLFSGDYDKAYDGDKEALALPDKLAEYYAKAGFINVNESIGNYEEKVVIVNPNGFTSWKKSIPELEKSLDSMKAFN